MDDHRSFQLAPSCDFLLKILTIIISQCSLGMSYRIRVHAHTRQIVYYRIHASWTFVYIIKPSSPSAYGVSLRLRTFLKLRANLPFTSFSESSLYGLLRPLARARRVYARAFSFETAVKSF